MTQNVEPAEETLPQPEEDPTTENRIVDDRRLARECITAADELIALAIEAERAGELERARGLVGRGSDAIASALYHLREAKRSAV